MSAGASALAARLDARARDHAFATALGEAPEHPDVRALAAMTAPVVVAVPRAHSETMTATLGALARVAALPGYREIRLNGLPDDLRRDPGTPGVFLGVDFHLGPSGPRIIEINTNAGGAYVGLALAQAWREAGAVPVGDPAAIAAAIDGMWLAEWRSARPAADAPPRVAIVDDEPRSQFLWPEFRMAARRLAALGWDARIDDPGALQWSGGRLAHGGNTIDVVYNRLTDFGFAESRHANVRSAYAAGAALITPHPLAHALLADKRALALLCDEAALLRLGALPADAALLATVVPPTRLVQPGDADRLWSERRRLFFKPATGFGSRAAYSGDKLTRGKWQEIVGDGVPYVAQAVVPPHEVRLGEPGEAAVLKADVRMFAHGAAPLLTLARLYRGQTTNFRTPGGGFAAVAVE